MVPDTGSQPPGRPGHGLLQAAQLIASAWAGWWILLNVGEVLVQHMPITGAILRVGVPLLLVLAATFVIWVRPFAGSIVVLVEGVAVLVGMSVMTALGNSRAPDPRPLLSVVVRILIMTILFAGPAFAAGILGLVALRKQRAAASAVSRT